MPAVERPAPALVPLQPPHPSPLPAARREGQSGQLVPPGELALADFARHLSLSARRRTAGAYLDTLQRLLAFQVDPLQAERSELSASWLGAGGAGGAGGGIGQSVTRYNGPCVP